MSIILALKVDPGQPVRRGSAWMWSVVRDLTEKDRTRIITPDDVLARTSGTEVSTVRKWLRTLATAGILEALPQGAYRCLRRPVLLPHITGDGRIVTLGQDAMWNAMRALTVFTVRELALSASTEEVQVAEATAERYVRALRGAGYFVVLPGRPSRYRLKPSMRSRTLAPQILRTKLVYDPNVNEVLGAVEAEPAL